ncbi:MAG: PilZ domain-containing protein [Nitrospirales bacterium]|nr:PilZ domain-containing protein [Nitrospirales bacterium]
MSLWGSYRSEGTISNLSTGGCAIHAMSSYQKGEEVLLVFVLPGAGQVLIRATVHWASWPFLGVGFCAGQDQAKLAVCTYLDNLTQRDLVRGIAIY